MGAVIWEAKAMAEQNLLRFNAIPTLPKLQDSPTSLDFKCDCEEQSPGDSGSIGQLNKLVYSRSF